MLPERGEINRAEGEGGGGQGLDVPKTFWVI